MMARPGFRFSAFRMASPLAVMAVVASGCMTETSPEYRTARELGATSGSGTTAIDTPAVATSGDSQTDGTGMGTTSAPSRPEASTTVTPTVAPTVIDKPEGTIPPVATNDAVLAGSEQAVGTPRAAASPNAIAKRSTTAPAETAAVDTPTAAREVKVLIPEKTFSTEGKEQALRVSYDDIDLLKVLNMDPVTPDCATKMPSWLHELDGKKVRIRGFMYPTFEASGITQFVLARDNQICCFGRNPKVYDLVGVELASSKGINYIPNRPFDVIGTFHINPQSAENELFGLYWITDAAVVTH